MKKPAVDPDQRARKIEEMMTLRFRAVFDSLDRLKEQWERTVKDMQRAHAADLRVTRMVLREHHQRLKSLEQRALPK